MPTKQKARVTESVQADDLPKATKRKRKFKVPEKSILYKDLSFEEATGEEKELFQLYQKI